MQDPTQQFTQPENGFSGSVPGYQTFADGSVEGLNDGPTDGPAGRGASGNLFTSEWLERLDELEELAGLDAWGVGPWEVRALARLEKSSEGVEPEASAWGCFSRGAEAPAVVVERRGLALLAAAALPGVVEAPLYDTERIVQGPWRILEGGHPVGRVERCGAELVEALSVLHAVLRSPESVAFVLEAAGPDVLRRAGRIVVERLAGQAVDREDA